MLVQQRYWFAGSDSRRAITFAHVASHSPSSDIACISPAVPSVLKTRQMGKSVAAEDSKKACRNVVYQEQSIPMDMRLSSPSRNTSPHDARGPKPCSQYAMPVFDVEWRSIVQQGYRSSSRP